MRSTHTFWRGADAGTLTIQLGNAERRKSGFSGFLMTSGGRVKHVLRFFHRDGRGFRRCEIPREDLINDNVSWEKCTWRTWPNEAGTMHMTLELYTPTNPRMIVNAYFVPFWMKQGLRIMMRRWQEWKIKMQSIFLSLACSQHPRLGEGSVMRELSEEQLRMIVHFL